MSLSTLTTLPDQEQPFVIPGPCGAIEAIAFKAKQPTHKVAILCHPHPLHEGTMHNKVIHTLSRAYHRKGFHSIRFNFRGVGKSEGVFGDSVGEIDDTLAVMQAIREHVDNPEWYLAGFSFGSYIAASVAGQVNCQHLISVAPAVHHQPYAELTPLSLPWHVIQGEEDEVVEPQLVYDWFESARKIHSHLTLHKLADSSHFFHAKLIELRERVMQCL